jgi:isopentenyl-diphosphate delta-isomerase
MHVRPESAGSYRVRGVAPSTLVLGNVGVVQAKAMSTEQLKALVGSVGADALCVHLNPAMELVQPGGDRDFSGSLDTIGRLVAEMPVPVVVKETGCGLSADVGRRLRNVGVQHLDVSGAGGTSWVGVEAKRAAVAGDEPSRSLGETLWDWGIPTAASVALVAPLGFRSVIATGGVATGVDVAKAIALGASAAGVARPLLKAVRSGGRAGAVAAVDAIVRELRAAMLLTGSRDVRALTRTRRIVKGELATWIDQLAGH